MKTRTDFDTIRRNRALFHAEAVENTKRQLFEHARILQRCFIQGIRCEVHIKSGEKSNLNSRLTSKVHSNTQETQCNLLSFSQPIPPPTSFVAICAVDEKAFRPTTSHSHPLCVSQFAEITFDSKSAVKANSAVPLLDTVCQMPGSAGSQSIQKNFGSIEGVPLYSRKGSKWSKYTLSKEMAPNVYLAYDEFTEKVVIKKLPHKAGCSGLPKETLAGTILKHNNVVSMQDYFQDEDNTYLVLEFIEGKDLFSFVQQRQFAPLEEEMARHIFVQLLEAVEYSHSVGVIHLDIKLENIILSSNSNVKLIDFGLCEIVKTASESIQCWVGR